MEFHPHIPIRDTAILLPQQPSRLNLSIRPAGVPTTTLQLVSSSRVTTSPPPSASISFLEVAFVLDGTKLSPAIFSTEP